MATFITIIFPFAICFVGIWFFIKSKRVLKETQRKKKELPQKLEEKGFKTTKQIGMTGNDKASSLDDFAFFLDSNSSRFAVARLTQGKSILTALKTGYDFELDIFNFDELVSVQIQGDSNIQVINGVSSPNSLYKLNIALKNPNTPFVEITAIGKDRQGLNHAVPRNAIQHHLQLINDIHDTLCYIINSR